MNCRMWLLHHLRVYLYIYIYCHIKFHGFALPSPWKCMDSLPVAPTFSPAWLHQKGNWIIYPKHQFSGVNSLASLKAFPHFLVSQIFIVIFSLFSICVNLTLFSREKKIHVHVTERQHDKIPKVEPREQSPAAAEVAAERRNRGPIADADAVLPMARCVWRVGWERWVGSCWGWIEKNISNASWWNGRISKIKKTKAWNVGRCCLFYLEMLAHLFSLLCKDSIYMDSMGFI